MLTHFYSELLTAFPNETIGTDLSSINVRGADTLPSWFAVTDLAAATVGVAGLQIAKLIETETGEHPPCSVDRRFASLWFKTTLRPSGWELPPIWNAVAGVYRTQDGWIRLHTNVAAHGAAAMAVLGTPEDRDAVTKAVAKWNGEELMQTIVDAGGCAAAMNSIDEWLQHPQGAAVAQEPLIHWHEHASAEPEPRTVDPARPLAGIRVLDLTRILAGPVSTRFLAAYGADVLRIDPPGWDEPANIPDVVLGKRCAQLNLKTATDRATFEKLIQNADLLVHGYRPDALPDLGYDGETLRTINPRLLDVSLSAYGWTGPWAKRRGFDSLVQMSSGIADFGMKMEQVDSPFPLPAQVLDHAAGYLLGAAAVYALRQRHLHGTILRARLSLARVAHLLIPTQSQTKSDALAPETDADLTTEIEDTSWGSARRIRFPLAIDGTPAKWDYPARKLHSAEPVWLG